MNIRKSINMALAKLDKKDIWLADAAGMKKQQLAGIKTSNKANIATITRLAAALNMKASELIALGED